MASEGLPIPDQLKHRKIAGEPDWVSGDIKDYPKSKPELVIPDSNGLAPLPVQQSDMLKPVYMDIVSRGLDYAYHKYKDQHWVETNSTASLDRKKTTSKPRDVIIVGAGMAGLSAAYELKEAGHRVHIVEMQERVGGRVKTFGEKDGFAKHLYADGKSLNVWVDENYYRLV